MYQTIKQAVDTNVELVDDFFFPAASSWNWESTYPYLSKLNPSPSFGVRLIMAWLFLVIICEIIYTKSAESNVLMLAILISYSHNYHLLLNGEKVLLILLLPGLHSPRTDVPALPLGIKAPPGLAVTLDAILCLGTRWVHAWMHLTSCITFSKVHCKSSPMC